MADDDRPQYQHGIGTIGGSQFHWGSGMPGKYWSIPYGDYPVTPDAPTGAWAQSAGAIPIANNVIPDPLLGRNRIGIMIHSGSAPDLDTLYTQGCFKVAPQEWPAVRSEILKEAANGPLYLHVAPGGVAAFTNTKTFSQAGDQTPAANANAAANTTVSRNQGPETVGAGPATAAQPGQPMDTRQLVFNKLTSAGLQPHQALGAVWSLAGESGAGLNPSSYNPNDPGGSVGIGQWLGPRRTALEAFAKARGTAVTDPNTQADFLVDELTNKNAPTYQPGVLQAVQGAKTAEDATKVWTSQFERPKVDNSDARIKGGTNVASLDAQGNFVLGGGQPSRPVTPTPATAYPPGTPGAPIGTSISSIPGMGADQSKDLIAGLSTMDKAAGGKGIGGGGGEEPQPAPFGPAPPIRNMSNPAAFAPALWGNTLNSIQSPMQWASASPGQMYGANAGGQPLGQQFGTQLGSLQQMQQMMAMMGNPYGDQGYG